MNSKTFALQTLNKSEKFKIIVNVCQELLYSGFEHSQDFLNYINNRLPLNYQQEYKFGYFPPLKYFNQISKCKNELQYLKLYYEWNNLDQFNSKSGNCFFEHHNLVFPICDEFGNIVGMSGRTLLSDYEQKNLNIDKYKNSFFVKNEILFGMHVAKESVALSKKIVLVEGQLDAISCHRKGFYNVVSLSGTNLSEYQLYIIRKYAGPQVKIFLMLDSDLPGKNAADKIIHKYKSAAKIEKIQIPSPYKDIDELISKTNNTSILSQI